MENRDWPLVEELFHKVLELSGDDRTAYLDRACSGNRWLRDQVESMILAYEDESDFIEQPAFSYGLRVLAEGGAAESLVGKVLGSYEILSLLGKGGMGEVYLAYDSRLDRKVALKFLSSGLLDDPWAKRRLEKEARAIARLDHPNICAVYGFEECDGYSFIVMQYVEGRTLASLIENGLIKPALISDLAFQILSALAAAHSHGIIHRDIKPQNIMVTESGQAKVLDFGLAKLVEKDQSMVNASGEKSQISQLGLLVGTVSYMSPEQLRSERLDFRTDLFSFGIVLYEMINRRNPYARGSKAETISAILTTEAALPAKSPTGISPGLLRIAQRCLKQQKEERYQSASEVLIEFENLHATLPGKLAWQNYLGRPVVVALLVLVVLLAIYLYYQYSAAVRVRTVALLPISAVGGDTDTEALATGLTEALANRLSRLSNLKLKSPTVVPKYEDEPIGFQKAGRDFGVDSLISAAIANADRSRTLQIRLIDTVDGSVLWQNEYLMQPGEMMELLEPICRTLIAKMEVRLTADDEKALGAPQTYNLEAYRLYTHGRYLMRMRNKEGNVQKAIDLFRRAIDLDPAFAQAWSGLADCYLVSTSVAYGALATKGAMDRARQAATEALNLDPTLAEAHTSLGILKMKYEWDWPEAERYFKRALSFDPRYAPAHYWYSNLMALTGRLSEAIEESKEAEAQDPLSPVSQMNLARAYYYAERYDEAETILREMINEESPDRGALNVLGFVLQARGRLDESLTVFKKLYSKDKLLGAAPLGFAHGRLGNKTEAREILRWLESQDASKPGGIPPQERALIYLGLNERDQAFNLLNTAYDERFASLPTLMIEPFLRDLRSDPRFMDLVRRTSVSIR